jgi:hypothetical protein
VLLSAAVLVAVPLALYAKNSDKVDGIHASRIPRPGYLVPLLPNGKFPGSVGISGPAGPAGPAGPPGVSGLTLVSVDTAADSSSPKAANANCPAGKKALSGGTELTANVSGASVAVQDSRPITPEDTGWHASATETVSNFTASWALRVWAVCASAT